MSAALVLAALHVTDGVVLVLLLLFGAWGAMRGALRQTLAIFVLIAALEGAGPLASVLAPTVGKVSGLVSDEQLAVGWLAAFVGCLVVGAILLAFIEPRIPKRGDGTLAKLAGGVLGVFKGSVVLLLVAYLLLGGVGRGLPGLRRDGSGGGPALAERLHGTVSASLLLRGSAALTRLVDVPPWIRLRMALVNKELEVPGPGPASRPKEP